MAMSFKFHAESRDDKGKGASRRLRRANRVPAIIYGAGKSPKAITLNHDEVIRNLEHEAVYSHILTVKIGKASEQVILRDLQRHPARPVVMHMDFQRIKTTEKLHVHVPLHFLGEDVAPGIKEGGVLSHHLIEVEVACLPKDLPEYLEVDISKLEMGGIVHLNELPLPEGIELMELVHGNNPAMASVHQARIIEVEPVAEVAPEEGEGEGEAGGEEPGEEGES